ncbi:hypothetical protein Micbo1qcDRAFT_235206 [Microdochium bolleyi]|uniref:Uncharacterized protein n=1 Tax=Microdochium bolleyi TaxID=196109 RepID=A0A136IWU0_9PEZI|nr:hypothetical protein Micbo1qcDRAFT_235206 [Microdochium bolleyi]
MGSVDVVPADTASEAVTLVITTSPTPSAPSTELLSAILDSFQAHCAVLLRCRVIVVLDTFDRIGPVARLKKGQVTEQGAKDTEDYKSNVKKLVLKRWGYQAMSTTLELGELISSTHDAEFGYDAEEANSIPVLATSTPGDGHVTFLEPTRRLGFGLAVRTALRMAQTPYVWIQQHDWNLVADIPLAGILDIMRRHNDHEVSPVQYVCLPSVRMLGYATSGHVINFPALKSLTTSLRQDFTVSAAACASQTTLGLRAVDRSAAHNTSRAPVTTSIPLTPMFFWHDKPHIASTAHYLSRVFPTRLAIPRGAFIEDTIGQRGRNQMKEGQWARWASWLYYPDNGQTLCLRHLQGRTWHGVEGEIEKVSRHRERNAAQTTALEKGDGGSENT